MVLVNELLLEASTGMDLTKEEASDYLHSNEVRQLNPIEPLAAHVSYISSNGYYGYSYVAHVDPNNNNNNNNDNNNNNNNNNNLLQTNCVNDKTASIADTFIRCKKRVHVMADDAVNSIKRCRFDQSDYAAAEYCNDFFSLPTTQIGTQACLMETEEVEDIGNTKQEQALQQQQQQEPQQQESHSMLQTNLNPN